MLGDIRFIKYVIVVHISAIPHDANKLKLFAELITNSFVVNAACIQLKVVVQ
jgi:hypothetical protein